MNRRSRLQLPVRLFAESIDDDGTFADRWRHVCVDHTPSYIESFFACLIFMDYLSHDNWTPQNFPLYSILVYYLFLIVEWHSLFACKCSESSLELMLLRKLVGSEIIY